MTPAPLVICSKSPWNPPARREHALAREAARAGHPVVFLERPLDIRAARSKSGRQALTASTGRRTVRPVAGEILVVPQATLLPGHRSAWAQALDGRRLMRGLQRVEGLAWATVVATQPWQWPAVKAAGGARHVFDCADDWGSLIPRRRSAFVALHGRIGAEADAVIAVSGDLADEFGTDVAVVPNGTAPELLDRPLVPRDPAAHKLVYAGTLSERFDATLAGDVLERMPEWSLDLYGPCQYAGRGSEPGPELRELLDRRAGRVTWHGAVGRDGLATAIDEASVAVVMHRASYGRGQDGMKLYDYAARGRPIVMTAGVPDPTAEAALGVRVAAAPDAFAAAVKDAAGEPEALADKRRAWAEQQRWQERWTQWERAALGGPA